VTRLIETLAPARLGTGFRWLFSSSWISDLGDGVGLAAGVLQPDRADLGVRSHDSVDVRPQRGAARASADESTTHPSRITGQSTRTVDARLCVA